MQLKTNIVALHGLYRRLILFAIIDTMYDLKETYTSYSQQHIKLKLQLNSIYMQCNRTTAIDSFFREMIPSPIKVGWVGSGCAVATEPTAELSQFYNITQVLLLLHVYSQCLPTLTSHALFPYSSLVLLYLPNFFMKVNSGEDKYNWNSILFTNIICPCLCRSYFQLLSSATHLSRGFSGIIRAFNWKRVALITQNELVFVKARIKPSLSVKIVAID